MARSHLINPSFFIQEILFNQNKRIIQKSSVIRLNRNRIIIHSISV
ncbi:hypothetical protein LEP1GSC166_3670 [Leptospira kirschneri]|nr:hypothetical protein LEP1GSC198_1630 [Leptospira kirschneri str. JB]EMK10796.1 hypothetical protein LEP1GSC166_3670 [Leptospira kirschneri]